MKILSVLLVIFLCLEIFLNQITGQSPFPTVCNNTVLSNWDTGGICYNISNDKATWSVANATCVRNGGRLARISNGEISDEIQRIINDKNGTEDYWIGLKRVGNTGQFQWTDGTNLTYNKWIINIPIQEFGCVGVKGWYWFSLNCTESHYYICETDVCIGWRVRNGICYKKFETNTNWNGAVGFCERKNAYLAEIPNIYVSDQINYLIGQDECWIGLSTNCTDYSWRIGNFSLSDPTTAVALKNEDTNKCGTIGVDGGNRWGLRDCIDTQTCAVCMKGPLMSEYPIHSCRNVHNEWVIVDRGICYRRIIRRNTELDLASLTCNRFNGELYRFNEAEPNLRLIDIFNSFYSNNVYPKLLPNQCNLFTPQDGYFNLLTSNVKCAPVKCLQLNNGELQETDCTSVNFICKIEYEPNKRILERTLTNETCYWSVTGNSNWTEAETECATEGGHLVEIFNEDTQNIIVSLIATEEEYLDELYWIGIGEYVNSSSQWRSGASIVFSNFSIITTYLDSRCVAIDKSGSWNILDCENKYSFVCGKYVTGVDNSPCPNPTTATTLIQNTTQPTNATTQQPIPTLDTQSEDTTNCNTKLSENPTCGRISETLENGKNVASIQEKEKLIEVILTSVDVMTGTILEFMSSKLNAVLILVRYNQSQNITIHIGENTLEINKGSFPADATVIIAIYGNTTISNNSDTQTLTTGESVKIVSDLITIVASENLIGKIKISLTIKTADYEGLTCNSLDQNGKWSSDGIETVITKNTIECITTHLTTFAVLVTFSTIADIDTEIQAYISMALCGLSLFALLITVLLYACIGKKFFKEDINIIQLNYVLSLIFALISFLLLSIAFFAKITFHPIICTTITLLNHYTWLSVFSWNFCQAIHIVFALFSNKLPFKRHYLLMLAVGWGLPIPIVIITFGVGVANNGYFDTVANLCFLNIKNGFIWALLGPIYIIILINLSVLFMVIGISIYVQRNRRTKSYLCRLIIGIATTIPLLGLPWILGLLPNIAGLTNNAELSWLSYIFVIFNASQGIIFFVVHVIRNADVRALCSSGEKAAIDIEPDDKKEKKQREEMEGRLRGTEGKYTSKREVPPMYFTQSTEVNVLYQNENVYS